MPVPERRAMGALEAEVLSKVWATEDGATPAQVLESLGGALAYTTVMTVLIRLWKKGLLTRSREGRAYVYRPAVAEADLAAGRMRAQLQRVTDPEATLSRFVGQLTDDEEGMLRRVLGELE